MLEEQLKELALIVKNDDLRKYAGNAFWNLIQAVISKDPVSGTLAGKDVKQIVFHMPTVIFWNKIKKDRNKSKAIYMDEIWRLIGVTSNKEVASFIYKIFKTIRKYGGSAVAITQDISDLFSLEDGTYGKSILNNSEIKTFFALEEENIKVLEKYTNLSEKEKIEIKSLKRGECLMFIGAEHILTKIESANFEKEIIEPNKERNLL